MYTIDLFLHIIRLTTKLRGSFAEDMFKKYPGVILNDDMLEEFLGKRCGGNKYGVGNGLGRCLIQYDVGLEGFFMEDLSNRRDQKKKKGFRGINTVEVREIRA